MSSLPLTPCHAFAIALFSLVLATGCAKKQLCHCAGAVGGTPPASAEEQEARNRSVSECLERHGGGTIQGCPMPPSAAR